MTKLEQKAGSAPATLSLAEACRRVGISVRTAEKLPDFPRIIALGGKRVVARRRFETWLEEKFGTN
jgi:hypothetical protein